MNYRTVECSDRLPTIEAPYFVKVNELCRGMGQAAIFGLHDLYYWENNDDELRELWKKSFDSWLEPYELPTEEEIYKILEMYEKKWSGDKGKFLGLDTFQQNKLDCMTEAITNLLKGER